VPTAEPKPVEGVVSRSSPRSVPDTLQRLRALVGERGLKLFAEIDHAAGARSVGLQMQEATVLVFGNPRAGTPLMLASPLLALDLPMRVLVWADADDGIWVSYTSPAYLAARFSVPDELAGNLAAVEALVDATVAS
jgi:uncharacterized protein (DUF302 family)